MEDQVRVTSKDKDALQSVIASLKQKDFNIDMTFTNYRWTAMIYHLIPEKQLSSIIFPEAQEFSFRKFLQN